MSTYATKRLFGGKPAIVNADVILAAPKHDDPDKTCLRAGRILMISETKDMPYISDLTKSPRDAEGNPTSTLHVWTFVKTWTIEEVEAMPVGSWTWPLPEGAWTLPRRQAATAPKQTEIKNGHDLFERAAEIAACSSLAKPHGEVVPFARAVLDLFNDRLGVTMVSKTKWDTMVDLLTTIEPFVEIMRHVKPSDQERLGVERAYEALIACGEKGNHVSSTPHTSPPAGLLAALPSVEEVAAKIELPVKEWPGNCCYVAQEMLAKRLVSGQLAYGHWYGMIAPNSTWRLERIMRKGKDELELPVTHGWILADDRWIIDPTRWVFEASAPYIHIGCRNDKEYVEFNYSRYHRSRLESPQKVKLIDSDGVHRQALKIRNELNCRDLALEYFKTNESR